MSTSCGAGGAFGILLSEIDLPDVVEIYTKLAVIEQKFDLDEELLGSDDTVDRSPEVQALVEPLIGAFRETGIYVPNGAALLWTGSSDDQPANCDTDGEQWILGYGLLTRPDMYPPMDLSFIEKSRWHTWVWMG